MVASEDLPSLRLAYSVEDVTRIIPISRSKIHALIASGEIPTKKVGRRRLITKQALEAWLADTEVEADESGASQ